ncbi:MAG: hypothetical protein QJT81_21975 [Candidatus Thiothrix putei]|uniref:Uncharacterized protein n=1 Tax=Candidatus Thiothrix putei TaxID=3080811 RepID=A0AA95HBN7_9GAMM|nr:MAG: hypothetical protein QJT81_21975 [Candidatus Thiothrix putei]
MKKLQTWLYDALLLATILLFIAIPAFFIYMLFFDPSEHGIPAKTAIANQQTLEARQTTTLPASQEHK